MLRISIRIIKIFLILLRHQEFWMAGRLRIWLLKKSGASIGDRVVIKAGVFIDYPENLKIGDNVSIQQNCFLSAYAPIIIGNNISIAHCVSIVTTTHPYDGDGVIREKPLISGPVELKDNCWIGMKASILHGVTIGSGVVVGAHALVHRSIDDGCVVAGIPARVIKTRGLS